MNNPTANTPIETPDDDFGNWEDENLPITALTVKTCIEKLSIICNDCGVDYCDSQSCCFDCEINDALEELKKTFNAENNKGE